MSTLYLVATPIGNLEDISSRALRILRQVRLIAVEDTRHTIKLLNHFGIRTSMISYHEHNKLTRLDQVISAMNEGDIALVSDAGTPALNDPGYELVRAVLGAGHQVSPIPGPCAPVAALVASGLPTDAFLYLGYLPRKRRERRQTLQQVSQIPHTLVFLESPHRLPDGLEDILGVLGDRQICVARELTKLHEDLFRGTVQQAIEHFMASPPRGEITLVIAGKPVTTELWEQSDLDEAIAEALQAGLPSTQIASQLAVKSGWSRREVYRRIAQFQKP